MKTAGQYLILVRHFFGRFFETESLSAHADAVANLGPVLGLLAAPGAFMVLLLLPLTLTGWGLITFRYFFISISMVAMGFLMVFRWDALFPDRQDYLILTPLPLHAVVMFAAKLSALALLLALFLVDANFFGALLWPGVDTKRDTWSILAAHVTAVGAAGLFAALAAASVQGLLINLLPSSWFRRVSTWLQTVLLGALVTMLFATPLVAHQLRSLAKLHHPLLYWFPGCWFIGLYERLRPATGDPALLEAGRIGQQALLWAAAAFVLTYIPAYRRHARKMLDAGSVSAAGSGLTRRFVRAVLHRTLLRTPAERGVFHFITATITRSLKHRVFLAVYGGFGVALALVSLFEGVPGRLRLPLTLSFILVSGLRAAFNFPSELRANWAFRLTEGDTAQAYLRAMRKWILACGVLPLFACLAPLEFWWFPADQALFHIGYGIVLSMLLVEVMFTGFHKVAFTCAYFPGKINMVGLSVMYVLGFMGYSRTMARLEALLTGEPLWQATFFTGALIVWAVLTRRCAQGGEPLDYDGSGDPEIRTLELAAR